MSMAKYRVPLSAVVITYIDVEADTKEEAIETAYERGAPGLMNLDHTYPDVSDWEVPEWYNTEEESN